jgi:chain length determinant protein (polysaccharide antigen chain regulator)
MSKQKNIEQQLPTTDFSHDEIDLVELFMLFWSKKRFLISWCFVITLIAIIIAFILPKVYVAKATFYPPTELDIRALNIAETYNISRDYIYLSFINNLQSNTVNRAVFDALPMKRANLTDKEKKNKFLKFLKSIKLQRTKTEKDDKFLIDMSETSLSFADKDALRSAAVVNDLLAKALEVTQKDIIAERDKKIDFKKQQLEREIKLLRAKVKKERLAKIETLQAADKLAIEQVTNQIKRLLNYAKIRQNDQIIKQIEASKVATKLGIKDPLDYKISKLAKLNLGQSTVTTELKDGQSELYMQGTMALDAKTNALKNRKNLETFIPQIRGLQEKLEALKHNELIEQLKARTNDDPFIPELRKLQAAIAKLDSSQITMDDFSPIALLEKASVPLKAAKPKKIYILLAGMFLALSSGIIIIFISNIIAKNKS